MRRRRVLAILVGAAVVLGVLGVGAGTPVTAPDLSVGAITIYR